MADDDKPAPPRVARIEVKGLFGQFDHDIALKLDERVTVLHGPNGVGKTTLLRMIAALVRGDIETLANIPFVEFRVAWTDGSIVTVRTQIFFEPSNPDQEGGTPPRRNLYIHKENSSPSTWKFSYTKATVSPLQQISESARSSVQRRFAELFREERWLDTADPPQTRIHW